MKKLNLSQMTRLANTEFPAFYGAICALIEKNEPTVEYVTTCFEKVKSHELKLLYLKSLTPKHHLSEAIKRHKKVRFDAFNSLKKKVGAMLISPIEDDKQAAVVLDAWLDQYRNDIKSTRMLKQDTLAHQMKMDIAEIPYLENAVESSAIKTLVDSIYSTTLQIKADFETRTNDITANKKKTKALRDAAYQDMKDLIIAMEMAIKLKEEGSDVMLSQRNAIATRIDLLSADYQNRVTRRKNAAIAEEERQLEEVEGGDNGGEENEGGITTLRTSATTMSSTSQPTGQVKPAVRQRNDEEGWNDRSTIEPAAMKGGVTNGEATDGDRNVERMNATMDMTAGNSGVTMDALNNSQTDADHQNDVDH